MAGGKKNKYGRTTEKGRPPKSGAPRALVLVCAVLAAGAAAASYANSLSGGFFFDNRTLIRENPLVSDPGMAGKIPTSHYWAPQGDSDLYRPLTIWTYHVQHPKTPESRAADYVLDARPYHALNLVLHALNAALAFMALLLILRMVSGEDRWNALAACLGAVLFAAHPIATEAVTNIVGRADLLVMFFLLLGFVSHVRGAERSGTAALPYYAFTAVCMALALLSKENAVAMIAVLFAYDVLLLRPRRRSRGFGAWLRGRAGACYALYAAVVAAWLLARYLVLHDLRITKTVYLDNPLAYMPLLQREATAIVVLGLYLWRMIWPVTLSADYSAEQIQAVQSVFDPRLLGSAAALIAVAVIAILMWRRYPVAAFLILFFFIAIFPVSNLVVLTGTIGAERLLYVSSFGWAGCLALGGVQAARILRGRHREAWAAVPLALLGVLAILYGVRTHIRNNDWKDELTLWRATAAASDRSVRALHGYAQALTRNQDDPAALEEARLVLERALGISDSCVSVHAALGLIYEQRGRRGMDEKDFPKAREHYERACEVLKRGERQDQMQAKAVRDEMAARGGAVRPILAGVLQMYETMGRTCLGLAVLARFSGEKEKYATYLAEAGDNFRIVLPSQAHEPSWHYEYGRVLSLTAEINEGDRRRRLYEEAAVSLWRAIILNISGREVWEELIKCYAALGHGRELIFGSGAGYAFKEGENENRLYQTRAFRSLIMISRVMLQEEVASEAVRIAAQQYGIQRSALEGALSGKFSIDDPRIFTGE